MVTRLGFVTSLPNPSINFRISSDSEPLIHLMTAVKKVIRSGQSHGWPILKLSQITTVIGRLHYSNTQGLPLLGILPLEVNFVLKILASNRDR